ncbi:MAG: hypothetical protein H3C34_11340 [Caldilineaceae bacterium]|nr:hypothetical protein [Caldilineaceae bacterium]
MYIVVGRDGRYYTGNTSSRAGDNMLLWTPYKKLAKRYQKRGWAEKVANKWRGRVEEVKG